MIPNNRFEVWLEENPILGDVLITAVLFGAMALAGWIDAPLIPR
ncbi:hypothetical protein [Cupriavidus necator]|nr:hypothetical protein [Cupriavidus necator]